MIGQDEVKSQVNVLLSLKKQYKDMTGEDFVPAQQPKKTDTAGKPNQTEPAKKVEQKKKQDQAKKGGKTEGSGKNEKDWENEQGKATSNLPQQLPAQESTVDKDGSAAREVKKITR